jgi:hypothetical protein
MRGSPRCIGMSTINEEEEKILRKKIIGNKETNWRNSNSIEMNNILSELPTLTSFLSATINCKQMKKNVLRYHYYYWLSQAMLIERWKKTLSDTIF